MLNATLFAKSIPVHVADAIGPPALKAAYDRAETWDRLLSGGDAQLVRHQLINFADGVMALVGTLDAAESVYGTEYDPTERPKYAAALAERMAELSAVASQLF